MNLELEERYYNPQAGIDEYPTREDPHWAYRNCHSHEEYVLHSLFKRTREEAEDRREAKWKHEKEVVIKNYYAEVPRALNFIGTSIQKGSVVVSEGIQKGANTVKEGLGDVSGSIRDVANVIPVLRPQTELEKILEREEHQRKKELEELEIENRVAERMNAAMHDPSFYDRAKAGIISSEDTEKFLGSRTDEDRMDSHLYSDSVEKIEGLIKGGFNLDVSRRDKDESTYLIRAAHRNATNVCRYLIEKGSDVNAEDSKGNTPLMGGIESGNLEICKMLLDAGANPDGNEYSVNTPLALAVYADNFEICKLLVEKGAKLARTLEDETSDGILFAAATGGRTDICKLLIESGADVQGSSISFESTPLYIATYFGRFNVCKMLIEAGAKIVAKYGFDKEEHSCLDVALERGYIRIYKMMQAFLERHRVHSEH